MRMKSPSLDIKAGVFYDGIPGYSIKVNEKVGEFGLKDILIYIIRRENRGILMLLWRIQG